MRAVAVGVPAGRGRDRLGRRVVTLTVGSVTPDFRACIDSATIYPAKRQEQPALGAGSVGPAGLRSGGRARRGGGRLRAARRIEAAAGWPLLCGGGRARLHRAQRLCAARRGGRAGNGRYRALVMPVELPPRRGTGGAVSAGKVVRMGRGARACVPAKTSKGHGRRGMMERSPVWLFRRPGSGGAG